VKLLYRRRGEMQDLHDADKLSLTVSRQTEHSSTSIWGRMLRPFKKSLRVIKFEFATAYSTPGVLQRVSRKLINALQTRSNLSSDLTKELREFLAFCTIHADDLVQICRQTEMNLQQWRARQNRSVIQQCLIYTSPIYWAKHLMAKALRWPNAADFLHPMVIPIIQADRTSLIFDASCAHLGMVYYFLEELGNMLLAKQSDEEILRFISNAYLQFKIHCLGNFQSDNDWESLLSYKSDFDMNFFESIQSESQELFELTPEHHSEVQEQFSATISLLRKLAGQTNYSRSYWLWYTGFTLASLYLCMRVSKIENFAHTTIDLGRQWYIASIRFFKSHLEEPLNRIYRTIRYDEASLGINASLSNLMAEQQALVTMVLDYLRETQPETLNDPLVLAEIQKMAAGGDLSLIINDYANAVKTPLKAALWGSLIRLVLIQVHKLKVDAEKTVVVMDQLMRANELNFQMLALLPALGFLVVSLNWVWRGLHRGVSRIAAVSKMRLLVREAFLVVNLYNTGAEILNNEKFSNSADHERGSFNLISVIQQARKFNCRDQGKLLFIVNVLQSNVGWISPADRASFLADTQSLVDSGLLVPQKLALISSLYQHHLKQ
jgi:hypothetical protein